VASFPVGAAIASALRAQYLGASGRWRCTDVDPPIVGMPVTLTPEGTSNSWCKSRARLASTTVPGNRLIMLIDALYPRCWYLKVVSVARPAAEIIVAARVGPLRRYSPGEQR
jgi:hypothetical protein